MFFEQLQDAYEKIYDGIKENSIILCQYDPCIYTIEVLTNLNILIFDYVDSNHCYLRARLIAIKDWNKAISGQPYSNNIL